MKSYKILDGLVALDIAGHHVLRIIIIMFIGILHGCSKTSLYSEIPFMEEEPSYYATVATGDVVTFEVGISLSELNVIADRIIEKHPKVVVNRDNFTVSNISSIDSNGEKFLRIEFEYHYQQIKTLKGKGLLKQKFVVWKRDENIRIYPKMRLEPL